MKGIAIVALLCVVAVALAARSPAPQRQAKWSENYLNNTFAPEGMYLSLRNDALMQIAKLFSVQIADTANTYTTMPDYSGSTSSASYTFSSFVFDIDLEEPTVTSTGAPELTVGWKLFQFIFQFNYHICANSWPNPCENGWIQVYTSDMSTSLSANLNLDLTGPTVSLKATAAALNFDQDGIEIYVDCTDTFCLIPTDDIANAVAGSFVSVFEEGMVNAINSAAATDINTIATSYAISSAAITLELQGDFDFFPATNPNIVFYADGYFVASDNSKITPPFTPTVSPPDSVFQTPASQLQFIFTDYMIRSAIWALDQAGKFNANITNADLPSTSPIHLSTNDATMQSNVPGLSNYPNMDIVVELSLLNVSSVDVTGAPGIALTNTFQTNFILTNSSLTVYGWTLYLDIDFTLVLATGVNATTGYVEMNPSFASPSVTAQLIKTNVGTVNAQFFQTIIEFGLLSYLPTVDLSFQIPTPSNFVVKSPVYTEAAGYGVEGTAFAYALNVPSTPCSSPAGLCPSQNTCCSWGCCTLPEAACCSAGCCPNGCGCDPYGGCDC